jgi:hypothetical protein
MKRMTAAGAIARRLDNHRLVGRRLASPADVVRWLGAVQAQDYAGAVWALAQRSRSNSASAAIDRAFDEGAILRTHILRPTWHFVAPDDLRWMMTLSAPRVHAANGFVYRFSGLDAKTLTRAMRVLERALEGRRYRTRQELAADLARARIAAAGTRLACIMMFAELEQSICSGPRRGREFSYALFDERVPRAPVISRDEALARLAGRYIASHGPATLRDFCWWSGLTTRDARRALEMLSPRVTLVDVDGLSCFSTAARAASPPPLAHLLPNYDEYLVAYRDRQLVVTGSSGDGVVRAADAFAHHIVVDGRLAGSWSRPATPGGPVRLSLYAPLDRTRRRAVDAAVARFQAWQRGPDERHRRTADARKKPASTSQAFEP